MAAQPIRLTYELRQEIRLRQSERAKIDSGKNRRIEDSVAKDHELLHPPKKVVSVESTTLDDKSKRCPVEDCKFSSKSKHGVRVHMARMHSRIRAVDRDAMLSNIPEDEAIAAQVREHGKRDVRQLPAVVPDAVIEQEELAVIDFKVDDNPLSRDDRA